jgi:hypothetical protein
LVAPTASEVMCSWLALFWPSSTHHQILCDANLEIL